MARFVGLLAVGVAIVVAYVRTGESIAVLVLSLVTFVVILAVVALRPWETAGIAGGTGSVDSAGDGDGRPIEDWDDVWRCGYDVTWGDRGVEAVAVGDRQPQRVVWSRIDGIDLGRHRASVGNRPPEWRRAVRLTLYQTSTGVDSESRSGPPERWLAVGPDQHPEDVVAGLDRARRQVAARRWAPGAGTGGAGAGWPERS